MSKIKILESTSVEDLTTAINEHLEDGWKIAGNSYRVCPETFWNDLSYSIMLIQDEPHVPVDPEILSLYKEDEE